MGPTQVLTFLGPGTQPVNPEPWSLGGSPPFNFSGWAQLNVLTPNGFSSPQAGFTLNCLPPTLTPTVTPTATPLPPSQVTAVTVSVAPLSTNVCPQLFVFSGTITVDGPTTVNYEWEQSDGSPTVPGSIMFAAAGSQNVNHNWLIPGPLIQNGMWARINILTPNAMNSNQATFDVLCP